MEVWAKRIKSMLQKDYCWKHFGASILLFLPRPPQMSFRSEILHAVRTFINVHHKKKIRFFLKCFSLFLFRTAGRRYNNLLQGHSEGKRPRGNWGQGGLPDRDSRASRLRRPSQAAESGETLLRVQCGCGVRVPRRHLDRRRP